MRLRQLFRPTHPLQLAAGLTLWALWFVAIYGGLSLACSWAPPTLAAGPLTWINALVVLLTLLTLALLLAGAWRCWRTLTAGNEAAPQRFVAAVAMGLYVVAAIATLAVGAPAAGLPPCL